MNFVVTLIQILFAAVLHISTIKTASINKEDQKTVKGDKNVVVSFMQVFNKSRCQTREVLVDIYKEYPDRIEHTYIPACVILKRCSGCCNDEAMECVPTRTRNVTMEVLQVREKVSQHLSQLSFVEHEECDCRQKPEVKIKKEKDSGDRMPRLVKTFQAMASGGGTATSPLPSVQLATRATMPHKRQEEVTVYTSHLAQRQNEFYLEEFSFHQV
uniref:Platelet-derived growth factor (PDGF) family profile domain-containing protein n=1 Tax=Gadus morhua TaxID=8049 RepID=A0A8C5BUU0_GADMO